MKCPKCKTKLVRVFYEGLPVYSCVECRGQLVDFGRLKGIQRRRDKTDLELADEIAFGNDDSTGRLRCSRCFSVMQKKQKKFGREPFSIDNCVKCKLIWLDSGELARMQVIYECSAQGQEARRFKERHENMTKHEKEELARRISQLPEKTFLKEVVVGGFLEALRRTGGNADFAFDSWMIDSF